MAFYLAVIVFALSLIGIAILFYIKHREVKAGKDIIPDMRALMDVRAQQVRELARAAGSDIKTLPPAVVHLVRLGIHAAALWVARTARAAESQSHRIADRVSYKHHFERRAPRSEFLQKVIEHKNGTKDAGEASEVASEAENVHNSATLDDKTSVHK